MKKITLCFLIILLGNFSFTWCQTEKDSRLSKKNLDSLQRIIFETEEAFNIMTKKEGVAKAFTHFAVEDAVLKRNETLIKGTSQIFEYYNNTMYNNAKVSWNPLHIDVAKSADLAYSYGTYTWEIPDRSVLLKNIMVIT